ncbi:S8 family serine peptidase [Vallicoccus soli]|uniref:Fibronectin type-III domain-containing protein n=1 Tax=Vallicoccus soli TaxID=2339232 RepID=A0A3A3Z3H1_9ACTN|nr:S8 family serine peptidase [Vallicoccus soli]RJK97954.1 hypothetical protein D5H78_03050 [Vallicoccus soli]
MPVTRRAAHRPRAALAAVLAAALLGGATAPAAASTDGAAATAALAGLLPADVLADLGAGERRAAAAALPGPGERAGQVALAVGDGDRLRISTVPSAPPDAAGLAALLGAQPSVEAAAPVGRVRAHEDPLRGYQWPLDRLAAEDLRADVAATGTGWDALPVVAVVDTGVDATHPDLAGRTVAGYDAVTGTALAPGAARDPDGHGTHVAGILGATVGNGVGVEGLLPQARIMPVRVLGEDGSGTDADVAEGVVWAAEHGARVVNLSLGGAGASSVLAAAVRHAHARGAVVVAASGNDGDGANEVQYPCASAATVLCVGATTPEDRRAAFSTHGPQVDVAAPGQDIASTFPGDGYVLMDGTSMATPYAAATVALAAAAMPWAGPDAVRARVVGTAEDLGPAGVDTAFGAGLVRPRAAAVPVPLAPPLPVGTGATTYPAPGRVVLAWTAPAPADGRAAVTGYAVRVDGGAARALPATAASVVLAGLAPGSAHTVSVEVRSAVGGPASSRRVVLPRLLPGALGAAAPASVAVAGARVRVTGRLTTRPTTGSSPVAVAGAVVELWAARAGRPAARVAAARTDATGRVALVAPVTAAGTLQLRSPLGRTAGGAFVGAAASPALRVAVRAPAAVPGAAGARWAPRR